MVSLSTINNSIISRKILWIEKYNCLSMYDNSKVDYNRINVSLSQKLGSKIYGVGNPNPSGYGRDVKELKKEYGFFEIKFGMNSGVVIETTSCVQNIPNELDNLFCITGSGLNLIGILKGIRKYNKNVKNVYGITLSKFFEENKKLYYDNLDSDKKYQGQLHIVPSEYPYQKLLKSDKDWMDWVYENKCWDYMVKNFNHRIRIYFGCWCKELRFKKCCSN